MSLEVLLVDDSADDRLLAKRAILKEMPHVRFVEPCNADELDRALSEPLDAAITDYQLQWSNGLDVLAKVKQRHPGVPVIMFTGTGSEEVCAEGMKQGLADYLPKRHDHYHRLPQSLRVAITCARQAEELERHRVERADGEAQLAALLERERAAREDAERAHAQAQQVNRLQNEFLSKLSHELRTPLTAMLGWAHLLQSKGDDPKILERGVDAIIRNVRAQVELIDDLLDASRLDARKAQYDKQVVDVGQVVRRAVDAAVPGAAAAGVDLEYFQDPEPGLVDADASQIHQIAANLLSNAIKFTASGGRVRVTVRRQGGYSVIRVADTGTGIDPALLPYLFDGFRQGDGASQRSHHGLGIGLAVVKNLCELHGATVEASSEGLGRGAEFVVSLPVLSATSSAPLEDPQALTNTSLLCGMKTLVVEDDADTRTVIAQLLKDAGAEVATAACADDALEHIRRRPPDMVLSDVGMPGKDGYQLIAELRATPDPRIAGLPAAALTAFARPQDHQRALAAGFDLYVCKPVEPCELLAVMTSLSAQSVRLKQLGQRRL